MSMHPLAIVPMGQARDIAVAQQARAACALCGKPGHLKPIDPQLALAIAQRHFAISRDELLGQRRQNHLVVARAFVVWALRSLGRPMSYPKIGALLGGRDHATIIHLHQKAIWLRMADNEFGAVCEGTESRFYEAREHSHAR